MNKRQNQISELPKLDNEVLENIFNVYKDVDDMYFYNLIQSISFPKNLPPSLFTTYNISYGDTWPLISYKFYKSTKAWWIILLANDIHNPLLPVVPGTSILVPITEVAREILTQIRL